MTVSIVLTDERIGGTVERIGQMASRFHSSRLETGQLYRHFRLTFHPLNMNPCVSASSFLSRY